MKTLSIPKNIFYGWYIVLAGSFLYFLGIGSVFYGFAPFFTPMVTEFGWGRAVTSGAYALSRLEGGIEGPIIGYLIDRFGARRLIFIGVIMVGVGYIAMSFVQNAISFYLIYGFLIALGYNTGFFHATTTATANWFIKKRSRALSFITVGGGLGGAIIVPLMAYLISVLGWRTASVILGSGMLIFGLPVAFMIKSRPEDMGMLPDNEQPVERLDPTARDGNTADDDSPARTSALDEVEITVWEALKTVTFWTYALAMMLRACILSALVVHQIQHLVDVGISYVAAANCLGLMVFCSIPGRLFFGWLGDFFDIRKLLFLICVIQAAGIYIFIHVAGLWMAYAFVIVFGLGYGGAIPLSMALRGELFGRKIFATIGGIISTLTTITTVAAPVLAGLVYDVFQSYSKAFYTFIVLILLSGVTFLLIKPIQVKGAPAASQAAG